MAVPEPEEEGDGYIKEVIRVEYEWKPPHCVDCQSFGHETNLCPKRVREELPKNSARDTKATAMERMMMVLLEVKSTQNKEMIMGDSGKTIKGASEQVNSDF
ncbi:hypothetical protein Tco_0750824 [Tanacetum coccineum]|uniref:DUF4283 domain-containing protein n=1 Tax=Tanacetum coccineum TaxID=301880 RepID=A0ABQ4Z288_9ASTR